MLSKILRFGAFLTFPLALASTAAAQEYGYDGAEPPAGLMLFSGENFQGEIREVFEPVYTLHDYQFNDRPRSVAVLSGAWELCEDVNFTGRCVFVRQDVDDLGWFGLNREITSVRPIYEYTEAQHGLMFVREESGHIRYADSYYGYDDYNYGYNSSLSVSVYHYGYSPHYRSYGYYDPHLGYGPYGFAWTRHGVNRNYGHNRRRHYERPPLKGHYGARNGDVTLYVDAHDRGPSLGLNRDIADLSRYRFNDNVSSVRIRSGVWELCEHANYRGRCQTVDASVDRLNGIRLNDNISSIRRIGDSPKAGRGDRDGRGERGDHDGTRRDRGGDGDRRGRGGRDGDGDRRDRGSGRQGALAGGPAETPAVTPPTTPRITRGGNPDTRTDRPRQDFRARTDSVDRNRNAGQRRQANTPPVQRQVRTPQPVTKPVIQRQQQPQRPQATRRELPKTPAMRSRQEPPRTQTPQARPQRQQVQRQQVQRQPVQRPQVRQPVQRPQVQQPARQPVARPAPPPQRPAPAPQRNENLPKALRNNRRGDVHKD